MSVSGIGLYDSKSAINSAFDTVNGLRMLQDACWVHIT